MRARIPRHVFGLAFFLCLLLTASLWSQQPVAGRQAGAITALIPRDFTIRGSQVQEAKKGDPVLWNDIIRTERGGRVRLSLTDGSIINIGSEAQMQIVYHDDATQQSSVQLYHGKVRAMVVKLGRPESRFEVRTNQAVAGVIGTDEVVDASNPGQTTVLSLGGRVCVRNVDPAIPGEECVDAGERTTVETGKPPSPPENASWQEIHDAVQDTSPEPVVSLNPNTGAQGSVLEGEITGRNLLPVQALTFSGAGVSIEVGAEATETRIPIRINVARDAELGSRTLTFRTPRGEATAVFVVTPAPNFALQVTPPAPADQPIEVRVGGGSRARQVHLVPQGGFRGSPALTVANLPEGVTAILSAPTVAVEATVEIVFTAVPEATPGTYGVSVQGVSGGLTASTTMALQVLPVPSFTLALSPTSSSEQPIVLGTTAVPVPLVVGVAPHHGFEGAVTLSWRGLPEGVTASPESATVNAGQTATFQLLARPTTAPGLRGVTLVATSQTAAAEAAVFVFVRAVPDFALGVSPAATSDLPLRLFVPGRASFEISVIPLNNFAQPVALTLLGLPTGVSVAPTSASVQPGQAARFELAALPEATLGTAVLTIQASGGGLTHNATVFLRLAPQPTFALALTLRNDANGPLMLPAGGPAVPVQVLVLPQHGFSERVTFTWTNLPAGVSLTPPRGTASPGELASFRLQAAATARPGDAQLTLEGVAGTQTVTLTLFLRILPAPDFLLLTDPASDANTPIIIPAGGSTTVTLGVVPLYGFTGGLDLMASRAPPGIEIRPTTLRASPFQPVTITLNVDPRASPGPAELVFTGVAANLQKQVTLFLRILPPPRFALRTEPLTATSTPLSVETGGSVTFSVRVEPETPFPGEVELEVTDLSAGVRANPPAARVAAGGTASFVLSAAGDAPLGPARLTIRGRSAAFTTSTTLFVNVVRPATPLIELQVEHFYSEADPPELVNPPAFAVAQGARLRFDASASRVPGGQVVAYQWQVLNTTLAGNQPRFDLDTWQLAAGTYRLQLEVTSNRGTRARVEYTVSVRELPNPDEILQGLRQAYETLQPNQYLAYFDPVRFRDYPNLEERIRNSMQQVNEARVYLRIDNRSRQRDEATYQAVFEVTFRTKDKPEEERKRLESVTTRLLLVRSRASEVWKVVDFSVIVTDLLRPRFRLACDPVTSLTQPLLVVAGSQTRIQCTVIGENEFRDAVALRVIPPANVGITSIPETAELRPDQTQTFLLQTSPTTPTGTLSVDILGEAGTLRALVQEFLQITPPPSFRLTTTPATSSLQPLALVRGGPAQAVEVSVVGEPGFTGTVALAVSTLPAGVSVTPTSASIQAGQTARFIFAASTSASTGTLLVNILGQSGVVRASTELFLTVNPPASFALTLNPTSLVLVPGLEGRSVQLGVVGEGGFASPVSITITSPSGVSVTPASISLSPGQITTLTFTATAAARTGSFAADIVGVSGTQRVSVQLPLQIAATSFDLAVSPATPIPPGGSATYSISLAPQPVFGFPVSFSVSGLPPGATASFSPTSATPPATVTLRVDTTAATPTGRFPLTITATGGAIIKTAAVDLVIARPTIALNPNSLDFKATARGPNPASQIVTLSNTGASTLNFQAAASSTPAGWLNVTPANGSLAPGASTTLTVDVNIAGVAVGSFTGSITVSDPLASNSPQTVSVNLAVAGEPAIGLTPASLNFTAPAGGANPANQLVTLSNTGNTTLNFTVAAGSTPAGWLSVTPANGTLAPGASTPLTVAVNIAGLITGTFAGTITVSDPLASNSPQTASVSLTLTQPTIALSPASLSFAALAAGANPADQTITLSNTGTGPLNFQAAASSAPAGWVSVSPASGSVAPGGSTTLTVTINIAGLPAGTFTGTITVSDPLASNSPQRVTVSLAVTGQPTITLNPGSFLFTGITGAANPLSQTLVVTNTGNGPLNFQVAASSTPAGWLIINPTGGSLAPGGSAALIVDVNITGLAVGTFTGTITVSDPLAGNSPQSVTVFLTMQAPTPDFQLSAFNPNNVANSSTSPVVVVEGGSQRLVAQVQPLFSFSGLVTLQLTGLPTGVTSQPITKDLSLPGIQRCDFNLSAPFGTIGSFQATLTGTGGGMTHSIPVFIQVTTSTAGFSVSLSPNATTSANALAVVIDSTIQTNLVLNPRVEATVTPTPDFAGPVTLTITGVPANVFVQPTSTTLTFPGPQTAVFQFSALPGAATGVIQVTLTAQSTTPSRGTSVPVFLNVVNQSFNVIPLQGGRLNRPLGIPAGSSATLDVDVLPVNGFTGTVAVQVTDLPAGVTVSPPSASVTLTGGPQRVSFTLSASPSASTNGQVPAHIFGRSGTLTSAVTFLVSVGSPDFLLEVFDSSSTASPLNLFPGGSDTLNVDVIPLNGLQGNIQISVSGPAGIEIGVPSFTVAADIGDQLISLRTTVRALSNAPAGRSQITVTGTAGIVTHTVQHPVEVSSVELSTVPASLTNPATPFGVGIGSNFQLVLTSKNNFCSTVFLTASGAPTGFSISPASTSVFVCFGTATVPYTYSGAGTTPGETAQTRIVPSVGAPITVFTVATGGTDASLEFGFQDPNTGTLVRSNSPSNPFAMRPGPQLILQTQLIPQGGLNGAVTLTVSPSPQFTTDGFTASIAPSALLDGVNTVPLPLTISATAANAGPVSVDITAAASGVPPVTLTVYVTSFTSDFSVTSNAGTSAATPITVVRSTPAPGFLRATRSGPRLTVTQLSGSVGSVNISVASVLPPGVQVDPSPSVLSLSGGSAFSDLIITATATALLGARELIVTVTGAGVSKNVSVFINVVDQVYLLDSPARNLGINLTAGTSQTFQIEVVPVNGFVDTVRLVVGTLGSPGCCLPPGITVTPIDTSVTLTGTGSQTVTYTITAAAGIDTVIDQFVPIRAQSSASQITTALSIRLMVGLPDFTVEVRNPFVSTQGIFSDVLNAYATPLTLDATSGAPVAGFVIVRERNGFTGTVSITFSDVDSGVVVNPTAGTAVLPMESGARGVQFTFAALPSAPRGIFQGQVNVSGGGVKRSVPIFFNIVDGTPASFQLGHSAPSTTPVLVFIEPAQGFGAAENVEAIGSQGERELVVSVTPQNRFSGPVTLSFTGLPTGVNVTPPTVTFNFPAPALSEPGAQELKVPKFQQAQFFFGADSTASSGDFAVTLTATGGGVTQTAQVFLRLRGFVLLQSSFDNAANPFIVPPGGTATLPIQVVPFSGFTGPVDVILDTTNLPAGVTLASNRVSVNVLGSPVTASFVFSAASSAASAARVELRVLAGSSQFPGFLFDFTDHLGVALVVSSAQPSFLLLRAFPGPESACGYDQDPHSRVNGTAEPELVFIGAPPRCIKFEVAPMSGFSGTITLTASSSGGIATVLGVSQVFAASSEPFFHSVGVLVSAASGTPPSLGSVTITGSATVGATTVTNRLTIPVQLSRGFQATLSPVTSTEAPLTLAFGTQTTVTLTVAPLDIPAGAFPNGLVFNVSVNVVADVGCSVFLNQQFATQSFGRLTIIPPNPATLSVTLIAPETNCPPSVGHVHFNLEGPLVDPGFGVFLDQPSPTLVYNVGATDGVTITVSPQTSSEQPLLIPQGGTATVTLSVVGQNGFRGPVNVTLDEFDLPAGITVTAGVSVNAGSAASPGIATFTFTASSTADLGFPQQIPVFVSGAASATIVNELVIFSGPSTFTLSDPGARSVPLGGQDFPTSVLCPTAAFRGDVTVAVSGAPAGVTITPASQTIRVDRFACFEVGHVVFATSAATPGTSTITLTATSGSFTQTTTFTVTVFLPQFSLSITPQIDFDNPVILRPGGPPATVTLTFTPQNNFTGTVNFSVGCCPPAGVTATPPSGSVSITGPSPVTQDIVFAAAGGAPTTDFVQFINIVADVAGTGFQFAGLALTVGNPDFSVNYFPGCQFCDPIRLVPAAEGQLVHISAQGLRGFTGRVSLAFSNVPPGVLVNLPQQEISVASHAEGTDVLFTAKAPPLFESFQGSFQATLTATGAGVTKTFPVFIEVGPAVAPGVDAFVTPVTTLQAPFALNPGTSVTLTLTLVPVGGFRGTVSIVSPFDRGGFGLQMTPPSVEVQITSNQAVSVPFTLAATANALTGGPFRLDFELSGISAGCFIGGDMSQGTSSGGAKQTVTCSSFSSEVDFFLTIGAPTIRLTVPSTVTQPIPVPNTGTAAGATAQLPLLIDPLNNFSGTVILSVSGQPLGLSVVPVSQTLAITGPTQVVLGLAAESSLSPQVLQLTLTASTATSAATAVVSIQIVTQLVITANVPGTGVPQPSGRPGAEENDPDDDDSAVPNARGRLRVPDRPEGIETLAGSVDAEPSEADGRVAARLPRAGRSAPGTGAGNESLRIRRTGENGRPVSNPRGAPSPQAAAGVDVVVRREEIAISPMLPGTSESVEFRVPVHNVGGLEARDVRVDFSIPALNLYRSERVDLAAGETITIVFALPLTPAEFGRPFEARILVDPDRLLTEVRRDNNEAVVRPEWLTPSAVRRSPGPVDRARLVLGLGECASFRFLTAATQPCNESGNPELELELDPDGSQVLLRADALQELDAVGFDQLPATLPEQWRSRAVLETGRMVAMRLQNETVFLRLTVLRRSSALSAGGGPAAPYTGRRRERIHSDQFGGVEDLAPARGVLPLVQVSLEWVIRR